MYVSIDPDTKGGAAFFGQGLLVTWMSFKKDPLWEIHLSALVVVLKPEYALLETANSRPGQSSKATFTHGGVFNSIKTILKLNGVPINYVTPQQWQQKAGVYGLHRAEPDAAKRRRLNKKEFKRKALELFPQLPTNAEGLYDAVLIGYDPAK